MSKKRFFNVFITIALMIVTALTIREAAATAGILTETNSASKTEILKCTSLPSRYSLRAEYVKEANMWMFLTEDGPTGVDGGLIDLMSNYRTCSR
jgi:hypothetical protein